MKKRIATGVICVIGGLILVYYAGIPLLAVSVAALLAAQYELLSAFEKAGIRAVRWSAYASAAATCAAYFGGFPAGAAVLFALCAAACAAALFSEYSFKRMACSMLTVLYPGLCIVCLNALNAAQDQTAYALVVCGIFSAVGSDTLALVFGRCFGRRKLCPQVSPNKTVEGALGGVIGGVLALLIVKILLSFVRVPLSWPLAAIAGVVGSLAAQLGDLFASAIKRYCKIKDYGRILPGHGGILDRVDGIVFSVAAMYGVWIVIQLL